jgi:hypothetical protein
MWLWSVNEMAELVSAMPAPQFGKNLRECEDQSWFKVQAAPTVPPELLWLPGCDTIVSQKVPGMVVLHCIWQRLPNRLQSTILEDVCKYTHTHTHTHIQFLHRSCHWHLRKASFGIFLSSAFAFYLISSMVAKRVPLRPIFKVGNS